MIGEILDPLRLRSAIPMQVFADVYHSLIHSPLSETLLQLEAAYASTVEVGVASWPSFRPYKAKQAL